MKNYETIFIIKPTIEDEGVKALTEKFKAIVTAHGAITSVDEWGKRKLAYLIEDFAEGTYIYMKYAAENDVPKELDRVFNISVDVIRHMTIVLDK